MRIHTRSHRFSVRKKGKKPKRLKSLLNGVTYVLPANCKEMPATSLLLLGTNTVPFGCDPAIPRSRVSRHWGNTGLGEVLPARMHFPLCHPRASAWPHGSTHPAAGAAMLNAVLGSSAGMSFQMKSNAHGWKPSSSVANHVSSHDASETHKSGCS